jgi:hypothetical protein
MALFWQQGKPPSPGFLMPVLPLTGLVRTHTRGIQSNSPDVTNEGITTLENGLVHSKTMEDEE